LPDSSKVSDASAPAPPRRNLTKTLVSLVWMYGGRGAGMLWIIALTAHLGIGAYGQYAMASAVMSLVAPTLNNPYAVRSVRESEERFRAERASRYLLGVAIILLSQALFTVGYVVWFGLTFAGAELVMRAYQSRAVRDGHPDRTWRMDSIRQMLSVGLGSIYLFSADNPTLVITSLFYLTPYVVMVVVTGFVVRGHRPSLPGPPKIMAVLSGEMLGTALYLQGDVLLLGWLTNDEVVGYYSITWVLASAIAVVGQSYGGTFVEPLREHGGDLSAGPPLRNTLILGAASGALVLLTGIGLLISPAPTELAVAMTIMAAYCALRTVILVFQTVLYAQRRDLLRLSAAIGLVPVKLLAVAALAGLGAVGAAIATVGADLILLIIFSTALYRGSHVRKADQ
jgi:O-antigen/teichoic acid export membrane protein